jgi:LysR family cys regulon transcriptional activator
VKTYVRMGLGVGIVASMAIDRGDSDLVSIDAAHLFGLQTTWAGFPTGRILRRYARHFLELLAPDLPE